MKINPLFFFIPFPSPKLGIGRKYMPEIKAWRDNVSTPVEKRPVTSKNPRYTEQNASRKTEPKYSFFSILRAGRLINTGTAQRRGYYKLIKLNRKNKNFSYAIQKLPNQLNILIISLDRARELNPLGEFLTTITISNEKRRFPLSLRKTSRIIRFSRLRTTALPIFLETEMPIREYSKPLGIKKAV